MQMDSLSDRLKYALEKTGVKKAELARAIGVAPQIVQFLCNGNTQASRFTFEIALALGLNTKWLALGEGPMFLSDDPSFKLQNEYKIVPVFTLEELVGKLPLNELRESDHASWEALRSEKANLFCIKSLDASMEPLIPAGSRVFFEAVEGYQEKEGDLVVAYAENYHTILVRKIEKKAQETLLSPANTDFFKAISLNNNIKIIGVVIECHWSVKK